METVSLPSETATHCWDRSLVYVDTFPIYLSIYLFFFLSILVFSLSLVFALGYSCH